MSMVTVTQLNTYLKSLLAGTNILQDIMVKGEISNFKHHYPSGHFYFTLKDGGSAIRAIMFKSNTQMIKFTPENGMSVIVRGSVALYEKDGTVQLYAADMQPEGMGALHLAYEQLKEKLSKEGLFDARHKKPIPPFPKAIGIVTSKTGAALQDIINVLKRRYPYVRLYLAGVLVQGEGAPVEIAAGIEAIGQTECDVMIVGRGGGSLEELWAFNSEVVARAIFASKIPIISAVGHETDFTIADFVADLRAPTPSAAAELAVPDANSLKQQLDARFDLLHKLALSHIQAVRNSLMLAVKSGGLSRPGQYITAQMDMVKSAHREMERQVAGLYNDRMEALKSSVSVLSALSPLAVLSRGYALAEKDNAALRSVRQVQVGDILQIRLEDGSVKAQAMDVISKQEETGWLKK